VIPPPQQLGDDKSFHGFYQTLGRFIDKKTPMSGDSDMTPRNNNLWRSCNVSGEDLAGINVLLLVATRTTTKLSSS
jgi:hypothetical protein